MIPSSTNHLNEIAKILAGAILRIEAATSGTNECNTHNNLTLLDSTQNPSITENPL